MPRFTRAFSALEGAHDTFQFPDAHAPTGIAYEDIAFTHMHFDQTGAGIVDGVARQVGNHDREQGLGYMQMKQAFLLQTDFHALAPCQGFQPVGQVEDQIIDDEILRRQALALAAREQQQTLDDRVHVLHRVLDSRQCR
jgi:hypothetical protein